jgi:hypothetical protein
VFIKQVLVLEGFKSVGLVAFLSVQPSIKIPIFINFVFSVVF